MGVAGRITGNSLISMLNLMGKITAKQQAEEDEEQLRPERVARLLALAARSAIRSPEPLAQAPRIPLKSPHVPKNETDL